MVYIIYLSAISIVKSKTLYYNTNKQAEVKFQICMFCSWPAMLRKFYKDLQCISLYMYVLLCAIYIYLRLTLKWW